MLVKVATPECAWCRVATLAHPELEFNVLSAFPTANDRLVETVEIRGSAWRAALEDVRALPTVSRVEVLEEADGRGVVRLAVAGCGLAAATSETGVVPTFPFVVRRACDTWLVVAERERGASFIEAVRARGSAIDILASKEHVTTETLTPRQREILARAVAEGYYEYPRRITLTRLAERMGIAKSTLSEHLMILEREIVGAFTQANHP